jgi:hypothetical protein
MSAWKPELDAIIGARHGGQVDHVLGLLQKLDARFPHVPEISYQLAWTSDVLGRAEIDKVPYTLVLGGKEAETQSISVRSRAKGDEGVMPFADYLARLKIEIATRALAIKTVKPAAPGAAPAN